MRPAITTYSQLFRVVLLSIIVVGFSSLAHAACKGPKGGREGMCAPDLVLKDLDGKEFRLSSALGNVVFVNFWATWCEPCALEIPAMQKLNERMTGSRFTMVSASIDEEGKSVIEPFFQKVIQDSRPNFQVLIDSDKRMASTWGTQKVPETYIIDPSGRIVDKVEGIRDWADSLLVHYLQLLAK